MARESQEAREAAESAKKLKEAADSALATIIKIAVVIKTLHFAYSTIPAFKGLVNGLIESAKQFKIFSKSVDIAKKGVASFFSTTVGKNVAEAMKLPLAIKLMAVFTAATAAAGVVIGKLIVGQADKAGKLKDTAEALDTIAKTVQAIQHGTGALGADFDTTISAIQKLRQNQSDAIGGNDQAIASFDKLGIKLGDLKKLSPEELWKRISAEVKSGAISVDNYSAIMDVMGKEAKNLISDMKSGVGALSEEWEKSALIIKRGTIDQLDVADKKIKGVWETTKGFTSFLASGIASGSIMLAKRAASLLEINNALQSMNPTRIGAALGRASDVAVEGELMGNGNGESLDNLDLLTKRRETQMGAIAAESREAQILKQKNDERLKELNLAKMTTSERKKALEAERDSLMTQIENERSVLKQQQLNEKLIEVEKDLHGIKAGKRGGGFTQSSDALLRVGGIRGGNSNPMFVVQNRQLSELQKISNGINKIANGKAKDPQVEQVVKGIQGLTNALLGQ